MYKLAKYSLTFYQHYSFTPDQFQTVLLDFSKKILCVKCGDLSSKKCKLSFLFSICVKSVLLE